jgi:hypothetical protein
MTTPTDKDKKPKSTNPPEQKLGDAHARRKSSGKACQAHLEKGD